jgi:hypothetical protein
LTDAEMVDASAAGAAAAGTARPMNPAANPLAMAVANPNFVITGALLPSYLVLKPWRVRRG